jgi:pilus assembly protein FimV
MSAGATLRIPSADEVFRISRGDALAEVQRQNAAWSGGTAELTTPPQPALVLVPPDDDVSLFDDDAGQTVEEEAAQALIDADEARIAEIEGVLEDHQDSLIEISDNELAALRTELAELRGEEPPEPLPVEDIVDDTVVDDADETLADDIFLDDDVDAIAADDEELVVVDDIVEDTAPVAEDTTPVVEDTTPAVEEIDTPRTQSLVDQILGYVNSIWGIIGGALLVAIALLVWFARRAGRGDDEDSTGVWESLEQDDIDGESLASTERLRALANQEDSAIVVVEQESALTPQLGATEEEPYEATVVEDQEPAFTPPEEPVSEEDALMESFESTVFEEQPEPEPEPEAELEFTAFDEPEAAPEPTVEDIPEPVAEIEHDASLDDTLHSETAINLDQADPAAEADFHMAYGLYDQAADLINGALDVDPDNEALLSKLCEIYFVWGNMDAFVDAASRMRAVVSDDSNPEWDKIVIMGQQIASDHEMFSGVSAGAATKAVDLSFEGGEEAGELDMAFESPDVEHATSGVIDLDLGVESGQVVVTDATAEIDFDMSEEDVDLDSSRTSEMPSFDVDSPAVDTGVDEETSEFPLSEGASDTPTIEQQFDSFDATGEMPAAEAGSDDATEITNIEDLGEAADDKPPPDATAEIDLDDLGLDLHGMEDTSIEAPEDELEDQISDFDDTAESPTINSDEGFDETGEMPDIEDLTDKNLALPDEDTDVGIDTSLLDVTGQTQVLSEDQSVDTASDLGSSLSDDDKTMLANPLEDDEVDTMVAPLGDDESTVLTTDIDFDDLGGTAALPQEAFTGTVAMDDTGEMPSIAGGTDLDLDLDDLTAALKVGDAADQPRDDETAEMPVEQTDDRSDASLDLDVGAAGLDDDDAPTQAAAPEDISGDSDDARTMTEVGTKLDLARAYVDMGDPNGARSILEEVLDEGDEGQRQQAQQILESMPS